MRDFKNIIIELKIYLLKYKNRKILDKVVAEALEISQANFATIKKRNSIPYKSLLEFCQKESLSANKLFFKQEN